MKRLSTIGMALWLAAAGARGGEAPGAEAPGTTEGQKPQRLVVIRDKTPVMFGNEVIGQLAEGTRVELKQTHDVYVLVRVAFDGNWFQGWVRQALTAPDSLEDVDVLVGTGNRTYVYEGLTPPGGLQFLEVRVRFTGTEKSPSIVYFDFAEEAPADLYLRYGRDEKAYLYGFMRRLPQSKRRVFDRTTKTQTLLPKPGETVEEAYLFTVPVRAERFELVLKDVVRPVRMRR